MKWEQPTEPSRRVPRPVVRVLAGLAVVALAFLSGQLLSGARDDAVPPDGLAVAGATPEPVTTAGTAPSGPASPVGVLSAREGMWRTTRLPDAVREGQAADGAVGRPVTARSTPAGIVLLRGRAMAVLDPVTDSWQPIPDFPGGATTPRAAVATDAGLVVVEVTVDAPVVWALPTDSAWTTVAPPPLDGLDAIAAVGDGVVMVGRVDGQVGQQVAVLPTITVPGPTDPTPGALMPRGLRWDVAVPPPADVDVLQVAGGTDGLLLLGVRRDGTGSPGGPRPVLLELVDGASAWTPRAAPPPDLLGSSFVALSSGPHPTPGAPVTQLIAVDADVPGSLVLSRYDVGVDRWVAVRLAVGDLVAAGTLFQGSWTGGSTVWFRSFGTDSVLLAVDLPTGPDGTGGPVQGPMQVGSPSLVVQPDGVMTSSYPIAVPDGVCLVPGRAQPASDATGEEVLRCWSADPRPAPAPAASGPAASPSAPPES